MRLSAQSHLPVRSRGRARGQRQSGRMRLGARSHLPVRSRGRARSQRRSERMRLGAHFRPPGRPPVAALSSTLFRGSSASKPPG